MANIVLYVAATESDANSGAADLERAGTRLSVVSAVSMETIRKRAPAADCVVFAETPTTAEGAHLLDVIDACGPTPLVLYTGSEYGPTTARATDGIAGYVRHGEGDMVHLADEIHWVCHEPERGTAQAPIPIEPSEPETEPSDATGSPETALANRQLAAQRDRLDAIERLVDHDLQNQLNLAKGYLTIATETDSAAHIAEVEAAHDQLTESVETLLDLAAQRELIATIEPVGLQDIARRAWARLDGGTTVDRTLEFEDDRVLRADKERLTEALEHLFRRAEQAATGTNDAGDTDTTGSITIHVGACPDGFFVADNATVPAETRKNLQETESETSSEAPSGLEVLSRIAEAHGWSVSIAESNWGGTRIEVTGAAADRMDVRSGPVADVTGVRSGPVAGVTDVRSGPTTDLADVLSRPETDVADVRFGTPFDSDSDE